MLSLDPNRLFPGPPRFMDDIMSPAIIISLFAGETPPYRQPIRRPQFHRSRELSPRLERQPINMWPHYTLYS